MHTWAMRLGRRFLPSTLSTVRLIVLVGLVLAGGGVQIANAQPPEPWTAPEQLSAGLLDESGQPLSLSFPTMVADSNGTVHAFWTRLHREEDVTFDGLLFYSRWDGGAWLAPVDVLLSARTVIWRPQAAIDAAGRIHLVWTAGFGEPIWYSSVTAAEAGSARAWSEPQQVSGSRTSGVGIAIDRQGRCHVVFCSGDQDDRCYYTASSDGVEWLSPSLVLAGCPDCDAHVAVDERGRLHAIFGSQGTDGTVMYYSRSEDGGGHWQAALELDRAGDNYSENYGPSWGTVTTQGRDEVHVIWFGAPSGQRWHCWSKDGGVTWSQPQQISSDHRGLTLPVATAFDSAGTLHLVSMGRRETPVLLTGAFHITWRGGRWSEPSLIGSRSDWDAEYAAAVVAGGNRIVAAWTDKEGPKGTNQIWVSTLALDAPRLEAQGVEPSTLPSVTPTVEQENAQPTPSAAGTEASPTPTSLSPLQGAGGSGAGSAQRGWLVYLVGVLPPLILVVLTLLVRGARQRRGG